MAQANLRVVENTAMDKSKALEAALSQIERAFGKGSIMKLGANTAMEVEAVSTGSLGLDIALGIGGLPKGRIIEIYGPESSGKTTLALHCLAEAQKGGGICAFVDADQQDVVVVIIGVIGLDFAALNCRVPLQNFLRRVFFGDQPHPLQTVRHGPFETIMGAMMNFQEHIYP